MVFVAKREVASWPLIGAAAKVQKVVFVDRTRRQQTPRPCARSPIAVGRTSGRAVCRRHLERRQPRAAIPLGADRRRRDGLQRAGLGEVTLQPMSICYTAFHAIPMGRQRRPLVAWYERSRISFRTLAGPAHGVVDTVVSFGDPIAVTADHDRKDVTRRLEIAVRLLTASALRARAGRPRFNGSSLIPGRCTLNGLSKGLSGGDKAARRGSR